MDAYAAELKKMFAEGKKKDLERESTPFQNALRAKLQNPGFMEEVANAKYRGERYRTVFSEDGLTPGMRWLPEWMVPRVYSWFQPNDTLFPKSLHSGLVIKREHYDHNTMEDWTEQTPLGPAKAHITTEEMKLFLEKRVPEVCGEYGVKCRFEKNYGFGYRVEIDLSKMVAME